MCELAIGLAIELKLVCEAFALNDTDFALESDAVETAIVPNESATVVNTTAAIFFFDDISMSTFLHAKLSVTPCHRLLIINTPTLYLLVIQS